MTGKSFYNEVNHFGVHLMARLPRLVIPNQPHLVIQRAIDRQAVFRDTEDYIAFLAWLKGAAKLFKVAVHAYVLMPDHLHLLVSPSDQSGLGRMMQWVGRYYVPYFNQKYHRTGTLWQGRYRATVLDADQYFITCCRYIEQNPVRAGLAAEAADYPWSSYPHHTGAKSDPLITDHPLYWALGNTPFDREAAYKKALEQALTLNDLQILNAAESKGWALGSDHFKVQIEKQANRRVSPAKKGRPPKNLPAAKLVDI